MRVPQPLGAEWPLPLHPQHPGAAPRSAPHIGPAAARDEYCARALAMTLRHIDLLPLSLIGARSGDTIVSIRVLGDGTINSVKVARSSGYPDIDARIEKMVLAVGQYPPLPKWIPGPSMDFDFSLHFPHPLER
jgi:TonB family protein